MSGVRGTSIRFFASLCLECELLEDWLSSVVLQTVAIKKLLPESVIVDDKAVLKNQNPVLHL